MPICRSLCFLVGALVMVSPSAVLGHDDPGQRYILAAARPGVSAFDKRVYEQLARVHRCECPVTMSRLHRFVLPPCPDPIPGRGASSSEAIDVLYRMGIDVLPVLTEALDDITPSRVPMPPPPDHPTITFGRTDSTGKTLAATGMDVSEGQPACRRTDFCARR